MKLSTVIIMLTLMFGFVTYSIIDQAKANAEIDTQYHFIRGLNNSIG